MEIIKYREKVIGRIINNEFVTFRKPEHFFVKYQGFGISEEVLQQLFDRGIENIIIYYDGKKGEKTYKYHLSDYINGLTWVNGDDRQKFPKKPIKNNNGFKSNFVNYDDLSKNKAKNGQTTLI